MERRRARRTSQRRWIRAGAAVRRSAPGGRQRADRRRGRCPRGVRAARRPLDEHRGRLLATRVAAGALPRLERRDEPLGERAAHLPVRTGHLGDHCLAGEDVALDRVPRTGLVPGPRVALRARVRGRAPVRRDGAQLPRLAGVVVGECGGERGRGVTSPLEELEHRGSVRGDPGGLRRDGADTRLRPRHDGADREVLRLHGDSDLARLRVGGADRERRLVRVTERHRRDPIVTVPRDGRNRGRGAREDLPKGVQALDGLRFGVPEGIVFGLLGPNGAGKSTTVKILVTLTKPDGGKATVAGHDVVRQAGRVRSSIGYVAQHRASTPRRRRARTSSCRAASRASAGPT